MSLIGIVALIVLGIILLLLEFFVIPGATVTGVAGAIVIGFAVFSAYHDHGNATGHYVLLASFVLLVITMVVAFRSRTWDRISLSSVIEGNSNDIRDKGIEPGEFGKTITRLAPVGKVMVREMIFEARSEDGMIDENSDIIVHKILNTQLIVKPKNA